jgi:hypothetical protein
LLWGLFEITLQRINDLLGYILLKLQSIGFCDLFELAFERVYNLFQFTLPLLRIEGALEATNTVVMLQVEVL